MPYELLIFDADETLFDFEKSQRVALEKSFYEFTFDCPYSEFNKAYLEINKHIWIEFEQGMITAKVLKTERFRRLFEILGASLLPEDFAKAYERNLAQASFVYDGVDQLLSRLSRNYRMAIITNGLYSVQNGRIAKSDIHAYFDEIVISEAVELVKPDPRIFDLTLERLGHYNKETVLMIGDNLKSDILGGIRAQLDTCWLNPSGKANVTEIVPTYEIKTVHEIESIL